MNHLKPVGALDRVKVANIQGNNHPTYDGVVARAHRDANDRGFVWVGTEVELKQAPHVSNNMQAIVWAKCNFLSLLEPGTFSFEGLADADPDNCNARTKSALVRMAATRAKSVALRDALNIDEALADEISEQGPPPQQNFGGQQQGGGGYQQNNQQPQGQGGGGNMPAWKYTIPGKKYPQGTRIDDPNVALDDIIYWHNNGLQQKNQQTGQYDMPDPERVALFAAEIAKRQGGYVGPVQNQQQNQGYPQQPAQQNNQQQGYQQQQQAPMQNQQPAQPGGWKPTSQHIANLVKQGNAVGVNYQGLKDRCMAEFQKVDPTQLEEHQYTILMVGLGGTP